MRRFRYGVQVNSLGLTEAQPENNVQRIVLEMLGVTLSKNARARAVQLPAWNEALGLPRPWDQQWSLRLQQVLAFESDLLEYDDIFDGSHVVEAKVAELVAGARAEIDRVQAMGGAIAAVESGYMKQALVSAHAARRGRIESGEEKIVGVNSLRDHRAVAADRRPRRRDHGRRPGGRAVRPAPASRRGRPQRDEAEVAEALAAAGRRRQDRRQPDGRHPGRGPRRARPRGSGPARCARCSASSARPPASPARSASPSAGAELTAVRERVRDDRRGARRPAAAAGRQARPRRPLQRRRAGRRPRPGRRLRGDLPGHPADPEQIVAAAVAEDVHCVGLSILSGSHMELVPAVLDGLREAGLDDVPVVVGGIIPDSDGRPAARARRGRGLHAQGLRAHRDHGRHRRRDPRGERPGLSVAGRVRGMDVQLAGLPDRPGPADARRAA